MLQTSRGMRYSWQRKNLLVLTGIHKVRFKDLLRWFVWESQGAACSGFTSSWCQNCAGPVEKKVRSCRSLRRQSFDSREQCRFQALHILHSADIRNKAGTVFLFLPPISHYTNHSRCQNLFSDFSFVTNPQFLQSTVEPHWKIFRIICRKRFVMVYFIIFSSAWAFVLVPCGSFMLPAIIVRYKFPAHYSVTPASELVGTKFPSLQLQQPASWSIHRGLCLTPYTGPCSVQTEGWAVQRSFWD